MKLLVGVAFTFLFSTAFAFSYIKVTGTVVSYDEKTITLKQKNGARVVVPRATRPDLKRLRVGATNMTIEVKPSDFIALNPAVQKAIDNKASTAK